MSSYNDCLDLEELLDLYKKLSALDECTRKVIKLSGIDYQEDCDEHHYYLSELLESDKGKKFLEEFFNHLDKKGYKCNIAGKEVSTTVFFNKLLSDSSILDEVVFFKNKEGSFYFDDLENISYYNDASIPVSVYLDGELMFGKDILNNSLVELINDNYSSMEEFTTIDMDRVVSYSPKVIGDWVYSQRTYDYDSNWLVVHLGDYLKDVALLLKPHNKGNEKLYSLLDEFCPSLYGGKKWSKPNVIKNKFLLDCINELGSCDDDLLAHLYMEGDRPTIKVYIDGVSLSEDKIERLTEVIVNVFGTNIKDVWFVIKCGTLLGEVIASKNPDGELTLTVY